MSIYPFTLLPQAPATSEPDPITTILKGMPSSLSALYTEILEHVAGFIDHPADVLMLALTCKLFKDICIPNHLCYRSIKVATHDLGEQIWHHLADHPHLARNVRSLQVGQSTLVHIPPNACVLYNRSPSIKSSEASRSALAKALSVMTNLVSFIWSPPEISNPWEHGSDGTWLLRIDWPLTSLKHIYLETFQAGAKFLPNNPLGIPSINVSIVFTGSLPFIF